MYCTLIIFLFLLLLFHCSTCLALIRNLTQEVNNKRTLQHILELPAGPIEINLVLRMDLQQAGMVSETEEIEGGDDPMVRYMQNHSRMA